MKRSATNAFNQCPYVYPSARLNERIHCVLKEGHAGAHVDGQAEKNRWMHRDRYDTWHTDREKLLVEKEKLETERRVIVQQLDAIQYRLDHDGEDECERDDWEYEDARES